MPAEPEEPVLTYSEQTIRLVAESLPNSSGGRDVRYVLTVVPTAIHPARGAAICAEDQAFVLVRSSLAEVSSQGELAAVQSVRAAVQAMLTAMGR